MAMFRFDNTFARELHGFSVPVQPQAVPQPRLLFLNTALATELGAQLPDDPAAQAALLAGNALPDGAEPVAQAYAGHQFGQFSPQLGDGRALLLGEVIDTRGQRRDIAFKGSGRTPFSRGGDGKAAVGPMLREVLIGEALHALGIPTTRALAVVATGEPVYREQPLPGAVLTRVAASHLRVGTFEYFAARGDHDRVRQLADYALARHAPDIGGEERYAGLLRQVVQRQAALVAQWMNAGFIHGVMNTDNMTISGESIDFGPCAFLEHFDTRAVFSSIDRQGRYCYGNQPAMAQWNLARLAESMLVLLDRDEPAAIARATASIHAFADAFRAALFGGQRAKLGLARTDLAPAESDAALVDDWLALLQANQADYTQAFRLLADAALGNDLPLLQLIADGDALKAWLARWRARCAAEDALAAASPAANDVANAARAAAMKRTNPRVIPRNHRVEEALAAASDNGDLAPFEALLAALRDPFSDDPATARYAEAAPPELTRGYRTFCGT